MFAFLATAHAATSVAIGWPCQRLNWGWRTVWTTCSINSFTPASAADLGPIQAPTQFRFSSDTNLAPVRVLTTAGTFAPSSTAALPALLCGNAIATGSGTTANLRNRCRRAIDAYGALVRTCQLPAGVAGVVRGPNTLGPDYAPTAGHQPHVINVQGLGQNAAMCLLPPNVAQSPANLATPSNTCPGLLGWFTVVFNACGFTNAPGMVPSTNPATLPWTATYFPIGATATTSVLPTGAVSAGSVGYFCNSGSVTPGNWNQAGATFRTSRCRKALDQFGRTAQRCHSSLVAGAAGPSQAGGFSDPLRLLAVGNVPTNAPASPMGINVWAPLCN